MQVSWKYLINVVPIYFNDLMQKRRHSSALAMEWHLFCNQSSISPLQPSDCLWAQQKQTPNAYIRDPMYDEDPRSLIYTHTVLKSRATPWQPKFVDLNRPRLPARLGVP